jgi:hypothetical protein
MRTVAVLAVFAFALSACPREDAVDHVGGAAGRQMNEVRGKVDKVEGKLEGQANEAAKNYE